jgi:urease accessory protein
LIQDLTIRRAGILVFRDRFCWQGPWDHETAAWHFGEAPACGTLFATGGLPETLLPKRASLSVASFPTAFGDTYVRCHGPAEAVIGCVVQTALNAAAMSSAAGLAEPWLLAAPHLAPNHWFTQLNPPA